MNEVDIVDAMAKLFQPKAVKAFAEGFTWDEIEQDVTEIMEEKAARRALLEPAINRRAVLRHLRRSVHPKVLARLKAACDATRN